MNSKETLEHIGCSLKSNKKSGWWYTQVLVDNWDNNTQVILSVSMNLDEEDSVEDAYNHVKLLMLKMVAFIEGVEYND